MKDITKLREAVKGLKAQRDILDHDIALAERLLRQMQSQNFIEANGVTARDVELSTRDDKSWFGDIDMFNSWIRTNNCKKRFAEWNGSLHYVSDLLADKFQPTPARIDDVPPS